MSDSESQELDEPFVQSSEPPVFRRFLSPSLARSSEAAQAGRCIRSPVIPAAVGSPSLRLFLSPSFRSSTRNSPSARASPFARATPSARASPPHAHTSANIAAGAHTSGRPRRSRKRKLTSDIWNDFTPMYDEDERLIQAQCLHCESIFPATKQTGSSQCRRHRLVCREKTKMDELIGGMQPSDPIIPALKRFKFDKEKAYHELVRMIVLHELPFRMVEYEGFRRFVASLNPSFILMSRTTIKNDIMAEFHKQKQELLEVLKNLPSRVSLTADLWTSNQELGYICITCHFVDNIWKLHKRIIKFASIETPHDATNLLNVMLKTMQEWGIEDKVCSISLDNAAVNDLMVSIPVVLDPRCKYKFLEFNLKDDTTIDGSKCLTHVKKTFKEMFNAYSSQENGNLNIQNEHQTQATPMHDPWASWSQHWGEQQRHRIKQTELDMYLKEEIVPPNANIDVLEWWMINGHKYPTISRMARDILAIPASTVASESAFSTGSRVISDYRSRLSSKTVDGLICLQDWMRPSGGIDLTTIIEDLNNEDELLNDTP